ncbi:conserved hypothetical protein [Xylanimonas cellulosilytica DSM 15894]|uniref:Muconolactone isomerase domain-containing protein n=1 Tax=Xylanimonas cellulosilytica (strain DSM 15894 / JCM 12276 / CECT 5975 / KCTC 9989 / LMG 20990 / NBRC 107835 / XIL07) TaxID=446471 RepID=D1BYK6_XYLCX|nr:muconolactone Delta-isomerase family protein [Xylanimonas cellulosilytica]ACZ31878.1 conserved hypothetical protein [Xylanimonas cellulosilytica DSM 15894]
MLFYVQMKWNYQGAMTQEELWEREIAEAAFATGPNGDKYLKVVGIYKVASQHRVIAIVEAETADDLDRHSMFGLPMGDILEFEHVWALRDYGPFIEDIHRRGELFA